MTNEPIAIVGIGCRFPKASTPAELWALLTGRVDAITEVPRDRFDLDALFDASPATPGKVMSRFGGFLEDIDRFDAGFFGISPREADRLDPQQRLLLEVAWNALEDAGYVTAPAVAARTGVFVGMWLNEYEARLFSDQSAIDFYMTTGSGRYSASGRLWYCLGLEGPSLTIDTACSSSLVAVHLACQSLRSGESDMALTGGVNVILEPSITIAYSQSRMMAPDGRCKFGDARGDGYVRSDGAGLLVLKRLSQATEDRDRIYAVIRGSAVNNDGRTSGFMATPGRAGQETMLRRAYRDAGVSPGSVQYVEAHGTGTRAGDPVELGALGAVLGEGRAPNTPCRVGSIKTNIGHTEGAAGVAGVIKVALSLNAGSIPPSLHFETPNPDIPWADLPLRVQTETSPFPDTTTAPIAGVSAFGIAGTNAHVVVQQYRASAGVATGSASGDHQPRLLPISSHTEETLAALSTDYADFLDGDRGSFGDVCYTAAVRRAHQPCRFAVVGRNRAEISARIRETFQSSSAAVGVSLGVADSEPRRVAFVFPGQGSQWLGMGRDLIAREPVFRDALERCDAAVHAHTGWSVMEELEADGRVSQLAEIDVVQPVLFSVQVALAALWQSWGIRPDAVVGHSMGEVAAACVAGALSLDDAAQVICRRSALLRRTSGRGAMAVVELSMEAAAAALTGYEDQVAVAVSNSRRSSVLSGDPVALDAIIERLEQRDVFCRLVKVNVASHSPQMDPLRGDLLAALQGITPRASAIPFYSTVLAQPIAGSDLDPAYWVRNLRQPVLFSRTVERLLQDGHVTFVEMSPHPLLTPAVQESGRDVECDRLLAVASTRRDDDERQVMLQSLAQLYVRGHEIAWSTVYPGDCKVASLPAYRWQRDRFWYDSGCTAPAIVTSGAASHGIPGDPIASAVHAGTSFWDFQLSLDAWPELRDHRVRGVAVVPATGFIELARAAATRLFDARTIRLDDVTFDAALWLEESRPVHVQMVARAGSDGSAAIEILSAENANDGGSGSWTRHASCRASVHVAELQSAEQALATDTQTSGDDHYERMNARGLNYGPSFRGVRGIASAGLRARGDIEDREPARNNTLNGPSGVGPERIDAALQLLISVAPESCGEQTTFMPTGAASIVLRDLGRHSRGLVCDAMLMPPAPGSDGAVIEGDVAVRDATGETVVQVRGLRLQRVAADRTSDDNFSELKWSAEPLARRDVDASEGVWLVLADRSGLGSRVAAGLAARHAQVLSVHAADALVMSEAATIAIRAGDPGDYDRLLQAALARGPLRGVVHLWSTDLDACDAADTAWPKMLESNSLSALFLAQACASRGLTLDGGIAFVTQASQQVIPADSTIAVAQAPVWGFNSVLRTEHPELRSASIDLGAHPADGDVVALIDELTSGLPADRVAFRDGRRYVARLTRADISNPSSVVDAPQTLADRRSRPFRVVVPTPGILDEFESRPFVRRKPREGEVEIEVESVGLNFMNVMSAMGILPGYAGGVGPLGLECAGRISAVGSSVRDFRVGDEVAAIAVDCLATHAITDARLVKPKPLSLSPDQAAGTPIAFITATYALDHLARMGRGERVLIHSAAGGVGQAALQLARRAGAEVIATAGTEEKREWLRSIGITHVFDSRGGRFAEDVLAATGGEGVDIVLNSIAGDAVAQGLAVLRPYGRFVEIGKRDIYENRQIGLLPFQRNLSYFAVDLDRMVRERPDIVGGLFAEVMQLFANGEIQPLPLKRFALPQVSDAFREMAQGRHSGKLVIGVGGQSLTASVSRFDALDDAAGGTVLLTGGLGALGLEVAGWLVSRGIGHIALVGRSGGSDDAHDAVRRLESRGAIVRQIRADVADRAQLAAALDEIRRTLPPLTGVVHAAGYLDDGTVLQQEPQRFVDVMRPKVLGSFLLDELTADDPLRFFVLMGSVASFIGSSGQSNYAAGNAYLDALAEARRLRGRPAISISWAPWSRIGLAARADRGGRLAARGLESLTPEQGIAALDRLMRSSEARVAVMSLDAAKWVQTAGPSCLPTVASAQVKSDEAKPAAAKATPGIREALVEAPAGRPRHSILETWLREQVGQVLRLPAARVEISKPFRTMGLDSLMGLELRNRIEAGGGIVMPATAIWNHPTIAQLVPQIATRMAIALDAPVREAVADAPPECDAENLDALIDELERLSDEEAQRLVEGER